MITLPLILTAIIGFTFAELLSGKFEGHRGKWKSIRIKVKDYTVHVHHWLYASFVLAAMPSNVDHRSFIEALLVGIIVQGLTYSDFYKVVYKEDRPAA
ncbi:MAG: hypothetical protein KGJ13_04300 [Patescibacteria group bacterium]|nr:hypothetical protein [Patescibacteria group bacterium]